MALTRITKGVIKPNENYDTHNINSTGIITATSFSGPFTGVGNSSIQSGIITATGIDLNGDLDVDGHTNLDNVSIAGVTTAAGAIDLNADLDVDGHTNLDNLSVAGVSTFSGDATFSGNVSIGGTLTYEDVTNIDSVGIITARDGLKVLAGGANVVGVVTATGANITGQTTIAHTGSPQLILKDSDSNSPSDANGISLRAANNTEYGFIGQSDTGSHTLWIKTVATTNPIRLQVNSTTRLEVGNSGCFVTGVLDVASGGTSSLRGDVYIADKIRHIGDDNTSIRFPAADVFTAETGGSERLRCDGDGVKVHNGRFYSAGTFAYIESSSTSNATVTLKKTASGADAIDYLQLRDNSNALKLKIGGDGIIYTPDVLASHEGDTDTKIRFPAADQIQLETAGTPRLKILSGGVVLIGNTTSQEVYGTNAVQVQGTTGATSSLSLLRHGNSPYLVLGSSGGSSLGAVNALADDARIGQITFAGADGTDINTHSASIAAYVDGSVSSNAVPGRLTFQTSTGATESTRMVITSGGSVNIGGDYTQTSKKFKVTGNSTFDGGLLVTGLLEGGSGFSIINGNLTLPAYTYHDGDSDTYYGFSAADQFSVFTGGSERLKIQSDGNMRWFPDGVNGVNLYATSGTSSVVLAANKNGSTGTTWHFKNQNSSGTAKTWMEVSDAQRVSLPYGMGGTNILNIYNTTGRDGINIFANVSSGNQNSDAGVINFNGYAQTNGAWIQGTNELAYGKKDLLFGTSYGNGNNYDTRDWDKPVQRLTYGGWIGMKEAATTNAAVKSLLHIKGNSDNGIADSTLTIEDSDTTSGSKNPVLAFDGNGTRQGRILSDDTSGSINGTAESGGLYFGTGSSNTTALQVTNNQGIVVYKDTRGWATVRHNDSQGLRTHIRQYYSPGNAVQTHTIMRIRRHWWGWGTYKIRCKALYYNSSLESTYYVNGHGSAGNNYSIANETFGGDAMNNSWNCTITHTASNNSPGNSTTWYADIKVNIPNYYYVIVYVEAYSSQYSMDPSNMGSDSYCMM